MFEKFMYPDMDPDQRTRAMRDSCDALKPEQTVHRSLTDAELAQRREEFPERRISLSALIDEKKAKVKAMTADIKKLEAEADHIQVEIQYKRTSQVEDLYIFFDYDTKEAGEYSATGELITRRAMTTDERQATIMHVERSISNG